uniref:Predicted protein n=1 Tax=Physcomitrium patens TaxID=3218 RepID=A9U646_PHYPA
MVFCKLNVDARLWTISYSFNQGAGPREGPQAPSPSGQTSEQRPQAIGVFQPVEGWGIAPHVSFLGDNRRADINISLAALRELQARMSRHHVRAPVCALLVKSFSGSHKQDRPSPSLEIAGCSRCPSLQVSMESTLTI